MRNYSGGGLRVGDPVLVSWDPEATLCIARDKNSN